MTIESDSSNEITLFQNELDDLRSLLNEHEVIEKDYKTNLGTYDKKKKYFVDEEGEKIHSYENSLADTKGKVLEHEIEKGDLRRSITINVSSLKGIQGTMNEKFDLDLVQDVADTNYLGEQDYEKKLDNLEGVISEVSKIDGLKNYVIESDIYNNLDEKYKNDITLYFNNIYDLFNDLVDFASEVREIKSIRDIINEYEVELEKKSVDREKNLQKIAECKQKIKQIEDKITVVDSRIRRLHEEVAYEEKLVIGDKIKEILD